MQNTATNKNETFYDYTLKYIMIGDSDIGKEEIFEFLDRSNTSNQANNLYLPNDHSNSPQTSPQTPSTKSDSDYFRSSLINCDDSNIRLLIWSASGQGRFNTILRSFSRGAQGIILVYDITNKWSFNSIERWYDELERSLPGIPKILIGNRLHLAFKRQVSENEARQFADKRKLIYYEISPLCDYNVLECLIDLSRMCLKKMRLFEILPTNSSNNLKTNKVLSLQELCYEQIIKYTTTFYGIDRLPLPNKLKKNLKSYFNSHKYELTSKLMNNQQLISPSAISPQTTCNNNHLINHNSNSKINDIYINSVINMYNLHNSSSNTNSLTNLNNCNNKSLKQNYKTSKKRPQRSLTSFHLNNDCNNNSRKTCLIM